MEARIDFISDDEKRPIGATPAKLYKRKVIENLDFEYASIIHTRIKQKLDARPLETLTDVETARKEFLEEAKKLASGLSATVRKDLVGKIEKGFAEQFHKVLEKSVDDVASLLEASETYPKIGNLLKGVKQGSKAADFKEFKSRLSGKLRANLEKLIITEIVDKPELEQVKEIHSAVQGILASLRDTLSTKEMKELNDISKNLFARHVRKQVMAYAEINVNDLNTVADAEFAFQTVRNMAQEYDKQLGITSFTMQDKERIFVGPVRGQVRAAEFDAGKKTAAKIKAGKKTAAKIKAEKKTAARNKTLASALSGTWKGYYLCYDKLLKAITVSIGNGSQGVYQGTLEVYPSSMNLDIHRRKYHIQAALDANTFLIQIRGTKWIINPDNDYKFVKFDGKLDKAMTQIKGRVRGERRCKTFTIRKQ